MLHQFTLVLTGAPGHELIHMIGYPATHDSKVDLGVWNEIE